MVGRHAGPRPGGQGYSWDDRRGLTKFGGEVGKKLLAAQLAGRKARTSHVIQETPVNKVQLVGDEVAGDDEAHSGATM